uniref:Uncharacterized protein n=1 Tax=Knipowitschia caucasica TaxID=637954 RepID=A0AAV2KHT2_KNICA
METFANSVKDIPGFLCPRLKLNEAHSSVAVLQGGMEPSDLSLACHSLAPPGTSRRKTLHSNLQKTITIQHLPERSLLRLCLIRFLRIFTAEKEAGHLGIVSCRVWVLSIHGTSQREDGDCSCFRKRRTL